jgi:hypothetical protein
VVVVELPRDQAPAVPPVEQTVAATLDDTLQLSGQAAEVGEPHQAMLADRRTSALGLETYENVSIAWASVANVH